MARRGARGHRRKRTSRFGLVTYLFARALGGGVARMPLGLALALARFAGRVAYLLDGEHCRIARGNLDAAYGESLSSAEKDRIILGAFQNLTLAVVEVIHGLRLLRPGEERRYLDIRGEAGVQEAASMGKGIIMVSGHIGNWELMAAAARHIGYPVHGIVAPRRNPRLERYIIQVRQTLGQKIMPKKGALRQSLQILHRGGVLAMMIDQNQRKDGIFVDFFGRKASTVRSAALLSRKTGAAIVPFFDRRLPGKLLHRVVFQEPISPVRTSDSERDVRQMTEEFTRRLEAVVRETPEQWLWLHRRWRTRPPEEGKVPSANLAEA